MPDWKPEIRRRLASLRLAPTREAAIVEELSQYLDDCYEELLIGGATEEEAYRAALAELSESEILARELRRVERQVAPEPIVLGTNRRTNMIADLWQDLRFGARMLLKKPGFTLIAVLTLTLGIGANTAVFSVINAVLLRSLPFAEAERLVTIWETRPDLPRFAASMPDAEDWRAQAQAFEEMAIYSDQFKNVVIAGQGEPAVIQGTAVSQNFFPMLGLKPVLGRTFLPEEEKPGSGQVVILSHALWRQNFAGDPGIIGKSVQIRLSNFTVVGVLGEQYPLATDVWVPLSHVGGDNFTNRMNHPASVIGRLKPGVTVEQARREMEAIAARLQQAYPASNKNVGVELLPLRHQLVGNLRLIVLLVFAAVALILLIACANISNLLLAQAAGRQKELALRAALGAGRSRLVRQLLIESLMLALLGGIAGLLLAKASLPVLRSSLLNVVTGKIPGLEFVGIDLHTLAFTFGAALLTGVLFGVLPALQIFRLDLNQVLKEGGTSSAGRGRRKLSRALVVAEVAFAVIVLAGAGLLVRSFQWLMQVEPGFRADHLLSLKINLPQSQYRKNEQVTGFFQQVMPRIRALPGVEQAAVIDRLPFAPSMAVERFIAEGQQPEPGKEPIAQNRSADQHFFDVMHIPLRSGRFFSEADVIKERNWFANDNEIIINETMARRFFPNQDPVGKHIFMVWGTPQRPAFLIIGVVGDIKDLGLDAPVEPEIYFPGVGREVVLLVRTSVDPLSLAAAICREVIATEPAQPIFQAKSVEEVLSTSLARRRFTLHLFVLLALLALLLAAIGIYGVVAYSVTQRTQEIGIRRALGAQTHDILQLVIGRGLAPVLLGVAVGLAATFALSRWLTSLTTGLLFEVRATDPLTFAAIAVLLFAVALLACYLPARRATKVDPMIALRCE
ncbi:MAG: ADOP family duplicated permease [Blastocatellia bacterium]